MACTAGDEVIQTAVAVKALASSNVQAGRMTVESGKCYNQVGVDINAIGTSTLYRIGIWDDKDIDPPDPVNLLSETDAHIPVAGEFVYIDIPEFTAVSDKIWIGTQPNGNNMTFNSMGSAPRRRHAQTFGAMPDPFAVAARQDDPPAFKIKHDGTGQETGGSGGTINAKQEGISIHDHDQTRKTKLVVEKEQLPDRPTVKSMGSSESLLFLKTRTINIGKLTFELKSIANADMPKIYARGVALSKMVIEAKNYARNKLIFNPKNEAFSIAEIGCQIAYTLTELHKSVEQENKVNKLKLLAEVFQNG